MILSSLLICACFVAVSPTKKQDFEWNAFKIKFGKHYTVQDDVRRSQIYFQNKEVWTKHNEEAAQGKHAFTLGPNEYSDFSLDEIKETMNGFKGVGQLRTGLPFEADESVEIPTSVDWREKGVITPVKNQRQCGSCWAFSSTGSLEAANAKKTGKLVSLSEQNLVDCTTGKWGNSGCGGGWMDNAFNYVKVSGGLDTEKYYPYLGQRPSNDYQSSIGVSLTGFRSGSYNEQQNENWYCFFNPDPLAIGGHDSGHVDIPKGNETALLYAVATQGPVSVAIDATHTSFSSYRSGVMYEPKCSSQQVDHAVLVVGYGTENGSDYWLVKNSWGESWGDKGYIKMARNRDNNCGIASFASYPFV